MDKTADTQPEHSSPADKTADAQSESSSPLNGSASPEGETKSSRRFSSYLQSVAQISGVATIIAATVYALGVFTLVLPISNYYNSTFAATWYATSVVPKTVVAGHGIKSLAWPSLALTLGTTLFALMVLWVLHISAVGWRYGRATTNRSALNVTSLAIIYSFLSVVVIAAYAVLFGEGEIVAPAPDKSTAFVIKANVQLAVYPVCVLFVFSYSVVAFLAVVRGLRYMRRRNTPRSSASKSFRGFLKGAIPKGVLFAGLSSVFFFTLAVLLQPLSRLPGMEDIYYSVLLDPLLIAFLIFLALFVFLLLLAIFLLILRGLRFIGALIAESIRNKTFPSISALAKSLGASVAQRVRPVGPTLVYSTILFSALYLVLLVALNLLRFIVLPRIGDISEAAKYKSWLDSTLIPLVVVGAFICLVIMYRKGWKGFGHDEYDLLSQGGWSSFLRDLLKSIGSRSLRSGLLWSFGVAYVVALASAFILAYLSPPPLPKVKVNEVAQAQSTQSGQVPAFQRERLVLLAHTEGYWYLIDENEHVLLVVPDRDENFIQLQLDEQLE